MGRPEDAISEAVIGACIEVHRHLGPGLLESVYEECLSLELRLRGIAFARQVAIPVRYKGLDIESAFRLDLVVENHLIVELKAVEDVLPLHHAQLKTYLKLTRFKAGLLVNFNVPILRYGLRRFEPENY